MAKTIGILMLKLKSNIILITYYYLLLNLVSFKKSNYFPIPENYSEQCSMKFFIQILTNVPMRPVLVLLILGAKTALAAMSVFVTMVSAKIPKQMHAKVSKF